MEQYGLHLDSDYLDKIKYYHTEYKCNVFQIFLSGNPIKMAKITKDTIITYNKIKKYVVKHNIILTAHIPYTINLSQPLNHYAWWIDSIMKEYEVASYIDVKYIVVHCGRLSAINKQYKDNSEEQNIEIGIETMKECLNIICDRINTKYNIINTQILLENTAGQKNELLYNFYDLLNFYKQLDNKNIIKLCLDTCHLFASGYKLLEAKDVDNLFELINTQIGISSIKLIHLNDSKNDVGSRVDRHEELMKGKINKSCIIRFIKLAKKFNIPLILETPNHKPIKEIKLIQDT
jgi:deoxyribonuclease-4